MTEGTGHNSNAVTRDQLRSLVERVERLEEEKKDLGLDIREVYGEAKALGYDTKALRKIIALRKIDGTERNELQAIVDLYMHALGMSPEAALAATGVMD